MSNCKNELDTAFDAIYNSIDVNNINDWYEDVKDCVSMLVKNHKLIDIKKKLEILKENLKINNKKDELKKIDEILNYISIYEPDHITESLKKTSYRLSSNYENLKKSINDSALRLLELTRLGKRDTVIGMLLRIFMIHNVKIPDGLIEALKNKYNINQFKAFIYAFLSGFIEEEKNEQ
jgi:CRISPR/Cas system-associated protein Cas5 (RAMP superfamily)